MLDNAVSVLCRLLCAMGLQHAVRVYVRTVIHRTAIGRKKVISARIERCQYRDHRGTESEELCINIKHWPGM